MHIRVLLSKYRSYTKCPDCRGARLKTDSLLQNRGLSLIKPDRLVGLELARLSVFVPEK